MKNKVRLFIDKRDVEIKCWKKSIIRHIRNKKLKQIVKIAMNEKMFCIKNKT